jgi:tripartite ATP-independent transporter DctP family solute receptor
MTLYMSRRAFTAGTAAAATCAALRPARAAADIRLKFAFNLPEQHFITIRSKEAAARIAAETNGTVELQIFPNNQLGGDTDMLSQVRAGGIDLFLNSGVNVLSTIVPTVSIYGLGFLFPDYPAVWKAMDGELGDELRARINKTTNLTPLEKSWDNGFRQITTSSHPIRTVEDLKGFKIRVPIGALWTSMFEALGAAPASINFSEIYSALQTKVVDGQENALPTIFTANLFEVQKYLSITNHMWDSFFCVANRKNWEALPADVANIVRKNLNQAAVDERADMEKAATSYQGLLAEKGMVINQADVSSFQTALSKSTFYKDWRQKYGEDLWTILERSIGRKLA